MIMLANCPNCKNTFEFSDLDIKRRATVRGDGKPYATWDYRKKCPHCSVELLKKGGFYQREWVVLGQNENK
ncbi:hypothetical protein [Chryseobacterium candidae]|uniref:Uncharacterized protein n=1 Tax=Chryseobacterium candidae TaxID=1978493 RepID=A0ABY2R2T9_9FLAO|nr:hypothetical protein [Chryseobacterium candidae]THV56644.1 hypothetical protein EK417_18185 [Chryseobacterium candidae]